MNRFTKVLNLKKEPHVKLLETIFTPKNYHQIDGEGSLRIELMVACRSKDSATYIRARLYHLFRLIKDGFRERRVDIYPFPTIHQKGAVLTFQWKRNKHMNTWEEIRR